jgi:6-phosphogluconolactonase/glucosamine-6-phosphate isomerase/deaminase
VTEEIIILPDPEAVNLRAASIWIERTKNSLLSKGRFTVPVSGGSSIWLIGKEASSSPVRGRAQEE